jgi:hypothetical protein
MKVNISREEKKEEIRKEGFFSRFAAKEYKNKFVVNCTIELSNEERAVAQKANILDTIIFTIDLNEPMWGSHESFWEGHNVTFEALVKGLFMWFDHPGQAQAFEDELKNTYLPSVKFLMTRSAKPTIGSESFEL